MSTTVPEVGDRVELVFGDDVTVRADVREQLGYAVWLAVPPVIESGRRLVVRWQVGGRPVSSSARIVRSSARQGLCVAIGTPNRRRRGATRHDPREPLRARLLQGGAIFSGGVVDLSFGGCCVAIPAGAMPVTAPVTVGFLRPSRTGDATLLDGVDARITAIDAPFGSERHVHVAFASVGVGALRIAALLGAVRSEPADAA